MQKLAKWSKLRVFVMKDKREYAFDFDEWKSIEKDLWKFPFVYLWDDLCNILDIKCVTTYTLDSMWAFIFSHPEPTRSKIKEIYEIRKKENKRTNWAKHLESICRHHWIIK